MRTLKKTLCVVLALVMMLGLCAFGTSAAFSDADKITYKEAVDVLTGIGVIKGMGDAANTFNPDGTLTRAQACTIITKLMGGDGISAKSTFTDMAGAAWAESYVAYCQAKGIVGGYGDGRFGPNDTLTGSQWGRMLLLAAGLDAKANGFESGNANWEIGVAKAVKDKGLAARITGFNATQGISRDAACEMAFKALDVSVSGKKVYVVDGLNGVEFETWFEAFVAVSAAGLDAEDITTSTPSDSLHSQNFPSLVEHTNQTDDFGRTTTEWRYGEKADVICTVAAPATKSFTVIVPDAYAADHTLADMLNDALKLKSVSNKLSIVDTGDADAQTKLYVNGAEVALTSASFLGSDEVEVYANKNRVVSKVIITRYDVAKVTNIETLKGSEADRLDGSTTKITLSGVTKKIYDANFAGFNYAKDDIILIAHTVATGNDEQKILASKKAETVEGTFSRVNSTSGVMTFGGKVYMKSGIAASVTSGKIGFTPVTTPGFTATYVMYLAPDGTWFAINAKTDEKDTSVAYVVAKYAKDIYTDGTEYTAGGARAYYVQCVNLDGDVVNYQVKKAVYNGLATPNSDPTAITPIGLKKITAIPGVDDDNKVLGSQSYVKLDDVASTFTNADEAKEATAASLTKSSVAVSDTSFDGSNSKFYLNASQKVIFVTGGLDAIKVTVKTGLTKIDYSCVLYGTSTNTSNNYNVKAIFANGAASTASTGTGLIYVKNGPTGTAPYDDYGVTGTANVYNVWIDGEAQEVLSTAEAADFTGVFSYTVDSKTGLYGKGTAYTEITSGKISNNNGGRVDFEVSNPTPSGNGRVSDIDLNNAKLVNTLNPIFEADAYARCATSVADLTDETITVVFSKAANGTLTATVVYITAGPTA